VTHSLLDTLRGLRGNARACILTEPLWGIPFNLFAPYASLYMLGVGLSQRQVGLVVSMALAGQIVVALFSGIATDKLGRKRATFLFDILAWTIPCLLWASARNIVWFLAAGLINSFRIVPDNSWNCLLVEDAAPDDLVHIYTWVGLAGQCSVLFVPLADLLIDRWTLVPAVRALYLLACLLMTTKFLILNLAATETAQGRIRIAETRGRSVFAMLGEFRGVARHVLASPHTLNTIGLMAALSIVTAVQGAFWAILVTRRAHIPAGQIAIYPFVRSLIMVACLLVIVPRLRGVHFARPLWLALAGLFASQILLIATPVHGYAVLLLSTLFESCSVAVLSTIVSQLIVVNVDAQERARIGSIVQMTVIACTTPFGWIAGVLSERNAAYPFVLNAAVLVLGALAVWRLNAEGAPDARTSA